MLVSCALTLAFDALMGDTMQKHAAIIAKCWCRVRGRFPFMLHFRAISINVGLLARTFENHKIAAFLMNIETTI